MLTLERWLGYSSVLFIQEQTNTWRAPLHSTPFFPPNVISNGPSRWRTIDERDVSLHMVRTTRMGTTYEDMISRVLVGPLFARSSRYRAYRRADRFVRGLFRIRVRCPQDAAPFDGNYQCITEI